MRVLSVLLLVAAGAACSSNGGPADPDPELISVGGSYQTVVTLVGSTCPGQTVQQHATGVNHQPGTTTLRLLHAGSTYTGTLDADGSFSTTAVTQVFDGISFQISITGQFTETAMDALVTVAADREPPCTFSATWAGPKIGEPNVIP